MLLHRTLLRFINIMHSQRLQKKKDIYVTFEELCDSVINDYSHVSLHSFALIKDSYASINNGRILFTPQ